MALGLKRRRRNSFRVAFHNNRIPVPRVETTLGWNSRTLSALGVARLNAFSPGLKQPWAEIRERFQR